MQRLSVVIVNYNYEDYVGAAIESALTLEWPDLEVIVVDDGSTDGSREVIARYAGRITALLTENATQRVAANRGFARSTGDVVIFLDSDDLLPRDLPIRLAKAWTRTTSKAQFRMQRIDGNGAKRGEPFPAYTPPPTPAAIRHWATETTAYPTPPGSGNAYSRAFLERILPVGPDVGNASDSAYLAAAPFFGDVITLPDVIVGYRRHGANDSDLLADTRRFPREVERARSRWRFAQAATTDSATRPLDDRALFRSRELLQLRVAARRMTPEEHPLPEDGWLRMFLDAVRAPIHPGPEQLFTRLTISAWCIATLVAPDRLAARLVRVRYGRRSQDVRGES